MFSAIKKLNDSSFLLSVDKDGIRTPAINLHGRLSEFHISDINNDGYTDILVGIQKKVKFDARNKKRINIYTLENNIIKPLWLGTKFINEIDKFKVINHNNLNYLSTTELINSEKKTNRIYKWDDFGFELINLE